MFVNQFNSTSIFIYLTLNLLKSTITYPPSQNKKKKDFDGSNLLIINSNLSTLSSEWNSQRYDISQIKFSQST